MYFSENTQVYLNGKFVKAADAKVGLYSQTMHYGIGVFEGIRSYDTRDGARIFKAKAHFERLLRSAELMHMPHNYSVDQLTSLTYALLEKNNLKEAYIRPLLFIGEDMALQVSQEAQLFIAAWKWSKFLGTEPLQVHISSYQRPNPKAFHIEAKANGHYVNSILASMEAKKLGYDEALLLDMNGNVAEGPGANIFFEKEGVLYTPPKGHILPGITRQVVMEMARERDVRVVEKNFTTTELLEADAAFFTGTAAEVVPIKAINKIHFKARYEETFSADLEMNFKDYVRSAHDPYYTII